jgi:hypothetical protein
LAMVAVIITVSPKGEWNRSFAVLCCIVGLGRRQAPDVQYLEVDHATNLE